MFADVGRYVEGCGRCRCRCWMVIRSFCIPTFPKHLWNVFQFTCYDYVLSTVQYCCKYENWKLKGVRASTYVWWCGPTTWIWHQSSTLCRLLCFWIWTHLPLTIPWSSLYALPQSLLAGSGLLNGIDLYNKHLKWSIPPSAFLKGGYGLRVWLVGCPDNRHTVFFPGTQQGQTGGSGGQ